MKPSFSEDVRNDPKEHITAHPIFIVEERLRVYGMDHDHAEGRVHLNRDRDECDPNDYDADETVGYKDIWKWVQPFFTRQAAQQFIDQHSHNLSSPRIYVASGHNNVQWQEVRQMCLEEPANDRLGYSQHVTHEDVQNAQAKAVASRFLKALHPEQSGRIKDTISRTLERVIHDG